MRKRSVSAVLGAAVALTPVFSARAKVIMTEDFESGLGAWTSNAGTGTTTAPPSAPADAPSSTLSFVDADGATTRIGRAWTPVTGATSYKLTYDVYANSNASSQRYYGQLCNGTATSPGTGTGGFFRIAANNDANSKWDALYSNGSTQTLVTATAITVGWHVMQLTVTPGAAGVGSFTYQIDGNTAVTTVSSGAVVAPTNVQLGQNVSNGTAGAPDTSAWFDSIKVEAFAPAAAKPTSPGPGDTGTNVDVNQDLSWTAATNDTKYDVYISTDSNNLGTAVSTGQAGTAFDPGTLLPGTTYFWRVDAKNLLDDPTTGDVWSFTTAAPEPSSFAILGLTGGLLLRRKRHHSAI